MGKRARGFWDRLAPKLVEIRVLTEVDGEALAILCTLLAQFQVQMRREMVTASLAGEIRKYLGQFGMTPGDRSKIQAVPEGEVDPFEVFLGGKDKK